MAPSHRCDPLKAYGREESRCQPMNLANASQNGVRAIRAICPPPCRHEGELPIERFPATMAVRDVGLRLRCTVCGRKGPETEPVWPRRDTA